MHQEKEEKKYSVSSVKSCDSNHLLKAHSKTLLLLKK
jgi:hypothetical protein